MALDEPPAASSWLREWMLVELKLPLPTPEEEAAALFLGDVLEPNCAPRGDRLLTVEVAAAGADCCDRLALFFLVSAAGCAAVGNI